MLEYSGNKLGVLCFRVTRVFRVFSTALLLGGISNVPLIIQYVTVSDYA